MGLFSAFRRDAREDKEGLPKTKNQNNNTHLKLTEELYKKAIEEIRSFSIKNITL